MFQLGIFQIYSVFSREICLTNWVYVWETGLRAKLNKVKMGKQRKKEIERKRKTRREREEEEIKWNNLFIFLPSESLVFRIYPKSINCCIASSHYIASTWWDIHYFSTHYLNVLSIDCTGNWSRDYQKTFLSSTLPETVMAAVMQGARRGTREPFVIYLNLFQAPCSRGNIKKMNRYVHV